MVSPASLAEIHALDVLTNVARYCEQIHVNLFVVKGVKREFASTLMANSSAPKDVGKNTRGVSARNTAQKTAIPDSATSSRLRVLPTLQVPIILTQFDLHFDVY